MTPAKVGVFEPAGSSCLITALRSGSEKLPKSMSKSLTAVRRKGGESKSHLPEGLINMPRFMGFVRMEEGIGAPPQAMLDAMGTYVGEQAGKGVFLDGGGLFGTEDAVNFVVRRGETTRVDGPYAEAKEVVGGWAILQYETLEEAIAGQQEFAELHAKYWPECSMVATMRQISDGPPEAAEA